MPKQSTKTDSLAHAEEIADGNFDRRRFFVVPIKTEYGVAPVTSGREPDMLNGTRAADLRDGINRPGFDCDAWAHFPSLAEFAGDQRRAVGVVGDNVAAREIARVRALPVDGLNGNRALDDGEFRFRRQTVHGNRGAVARVYAQAKAREGIIRWQAIMFIPLFILHLRTAP